MSRFGSTLLATRGWGMIIGTVLFVIIVFALRHVPLDEPRECLFSARVLVPHELPGETAFEVRTVDVGPTAGGCIAPKWADHYSKINVKARVEASVRLLPAHFDEK